MEIVTLLPWIPLTLAASLAPALVANRLAPWWQKHGDIGEALGTTLVAGTAIFTVTLPILSYDVPKLYGFVAIAVGLVTAIVAHSLFEKDGEELAVKSWFAAAAFALHNFPEGIASGRALLADGANVFTWSLLAHNGLDAIVMALGLMAMGLTRKRLVVTLTIAALGEVAGMLLAGLGVGGIAWISLVSVGALLGLALDSAMHWSGRQGTISLSTFGLLAYFLV